MDEPFNVPKRGLPSAQKKAAHLAAEQRVLASLILIIAKVLALQFSYSASVDAGKGSS
jgi:hypothetical protein